MAEFLKRYRVEKSRQSGDWLIKDETGLILRAVASQRLAFFIAFERHPITRFERGYRKLIDNVWSKEA